MDENKITRMPSEGILGGVCAGLGSYLQIPADFLRILFILFTFAGGAGFITYFILWLILPADSAQEQAAWDDRFSQNAEELAHRMRKLGLEISGGFRDSSSQLPKYIGGTLVVLGILFLAQTLNLRWLSWLRPEVLWALMLIAAGVFLLYRRSSSS